MSYNRKSLPLQMVVPERIAIGTFVAYLIVVVATCFAAIAAWYIVYNTRKTLEEIEKRSDG